MKTASAQKSPVSTPTVKTKMINVRVVPKDWDIVPIGDMFTFKNGLNKGKEYFGHGTPIVNYMDVFKLSGIRAENIKGRVDVNHSELQAYEVRKGDVFFTRTSETVDEIGISAVMLDDVSKTVFSGFILRARPKDNSLDDQFKKWCFSSKAVRNQITSKSTYTTRALTNGRTLSAVLLPRPSLAEQRKIAAALNDIDDLIAAQEELIAKKRDIKQATMQQLLTGRTRLPGHKKKWAGKKIGDLTDCVSGGTPNTQNSSYWNGRIKWMNSGELHYKFVSDVAGRITQAGLESSSTRLIPEKCVLIGLAGQGKTRGTVAMNLIELCTNQSIAAILPNNNFVPEFLYYSLDTRYDELRSLSTGDGGRGGLNLTIIKSIEIDFPPIEEQAAIASVLSDMDAEISALETELEKTRTIKQGMMQELLTGRIRLI